MLDHTVEIEQRGNTFHLNYYGDHEPLGYPNEELPSEWEGSIEEYPLEKYPGYQPDSPPDQIELEKYCLRDEIEALSGKTWGGKQGIGKLQEVGIVRPTDIEENPLWRSDERFFLLKKGMPDIELLQNQVDEYISLLESEGVTVHTFDMPAWGIYGPMRKLYMAEEVLLTKEGAILSRFNHGPYKRGLNKGFQRFLTDIDCPIIHSVHGYGVQEVGPWVPIGENSIVAHRGISGNQDGIEQLLPVLARAGFEEVHFASQPFIEESFESGGEFHIDMVLGILDKDLALVYPKCLDYETKRFLRERGFTLLEIPEEEHQQYNPANLVLLEPGKVIMSEGAEKTIRMVEQEGIEVIRAPTAEIMKGGTNGIRCITLQLVRNEGPTIGNDGGYYNG